MTKKRGVCDYCGGGPRVLVKASPFIADSGKKKMCSVCWRDTKAEYWASAREFIPAFRSL